MSNFRNFPSPHVHVQSLDSASTPEAFVAKEISLGTGTLTCTDHGSLGAAYKVYDLAKKNKLTPCIGLEAYFRSDDCPILTKLGVQKTHTVPKGMDKVKWAQDHPTGSFYDYAKYFHLTLGFQDYNAYLKGVKLLSNADSRSEIHGSERKALFTWDDLEELAATKTTLGSSCFVAGTLIRTPRGMIPIQDIVEGDQVLDCGKWQRVNATTKRWYEGEMCAVFVSENTNPIICTSEHPFLTYQGLKDVWEEANKLGRGDLLVTSCLPTKNSSDDEWGEEDLWMLGLFLAEGSWGVPYTPKNMGTRLFGKNLQFSLHAKETDIVERIRTWAEGHGANICIYNKKGTKSIGVSVNSLELTNRFGALFGMRVNSGTKFVPDKILTMSVGRLRHLVAGYFRGDGHIRQRCFQHKKTGEYRLRVATVTSVSETLILDIASILHRASLGFCVSKSSNKLHKDKIRRKPAYCIRANGREAQDIIDWLSGDTIRECVSRRTLSTVSKVESFFYKGNVYCLSVDSKRFALASGVMVHNCLVGMLSRHLINDKSPGSLKLGAARAYLERLVHLFGDRFYVEVFPHVCSHNFVKGIFITHVGVGETSPTISKYHEGKTLRTPEGEFKADELAGKWDAKKPQQLLAIKNYSKWEEFDPPRTIVNVVKKEGFVQNECTPASPDGDLQWGANKFAMGVAQKYNLPILLSDDSHFCEPSQKIVQDVKLAQMGSWKFYGSYHRQTSEEAYNYFKTKHGTSEATFESWVDNNYRWVEGFKGFVFDNTLQLPGRFYPSDTLVHTKRLIEKHGRMPKTDPRYVSRLKLEMELFHKNGTVDLLPYFFTCEEQCRLYENQGSLGGPSRGSAGGVLLSYLLGITSIDPIQHGLSLDRFLTLDRIASHKMPDVDLDFASRDLLCGKECDVIEVEAEDGTKHVLPEDFCVETEKGPLPIKNVVSEQVEFEPWW